MCMYMRICICSMHATVRVQLMEMRENALTNSEIFWIKATSRLILAGAPPETRRDRASTNPPVSWGGLNPNTLPLNAVGVSRVGQTTF